MAKATSFIGYLRSAALRIEKKQELAPLRPDRSKHVAISMVATLLFLIGAPYVINEHTSRMAEEERRVLTPLEDALGNLDRSLDTIDSDLKSFLGTAQSSYLEAFPGRRITFASDLEAANRFANETGPHIEQLLRALTSEAQQWLKDMSAIYEKAKTHDTTWAQVEKEKPLLTSTLDTINDVRTQIARRRDINHATNAQFTLWMLLIAVFLGILAILCCGYLFELVRAVGDLYTRAFGSLRAASSRSALLEAQLSFSQALIRYAPVAICVTDFKTSLIQYTNSAFERLPFLRSAETLGRPLQDVLLPGPTAQAVLETTERTKKINAACALSRWEFNKAGGGEPTFWNLRTVMFGPGERGADFIMLLWEDVTQETLSIRSAEHESAQAHRLLSELRAILNNMSDGVVVTNSRNEASIMNLHARELIGAPEDLRLPQPLSVLSEAVSGQLDVTRWKGQRNAQRVSFTAGASDRVVELVATPLVNSSGKVDGVVGVLHDITEYRKSQKEKDEFLALASHELKTPLTVLLSSCQMIRLLVTRREYDRLERLSTTVMSQLTRLRLLVFQLFDYASLQAERLHLNLTRTDLRPLIKRITEENRVLVGDRELETLCGPDPLFALVDELRIEEVMGNLLSNAMRYSPARTRIRVSLRMNGKFARIEASDQGIGVDKQDLEKIFVRFTRGRNVGGVGGMGVGLYLSSEIIRAHGGRIWGESPGINQGSTFCIELPLVAS